MKQVITIALLCIITFELYSQIGNTIIVTQDINFNQVNKNPVFKSKKLPPDLKNQKLFFIKTNVLDFIDKPGRNYRYDTTFNKFICKKLKKYPYSFEILADTFINKPVEYFLKNNYKYRLIVYMQYKQTDGSTGGGGGQPAKSMKDSYMVCIEDITTHEIYFKGGYHYKPFFIYKLKRKLRRL